MREWSFKTPDEETLVKIIVNDFGDGMMFKYDLYNSGNCYEMSIIGHPVASEVRRLIKENDNHKQK